MRVISGSARGLKLRAPKGIKTRPTTDRIKESFFNIINPYLYECRFLDLFSGSGAIGIEALSRGAQKAVFVDSGRESIEVIRANIEAARLSDRASVVDSDVFAAVSRLGSKNDRFDIIFMDPPYSKGLVEKTLRAVLNADILVPDGFIVAEQAAGDERPDIEGLEIYRIKDYKTTKMLYIRRIDEKSSIPGQL